MEPKTYIQLQEEYGGKFIAIKEKQVIATGNTHKELVENLQKSHIERKGLIFEFIEPKDVICIYNISIKR